MGRSHRLAKLFGAVALATGGALWLAVSTVAAGDSISTGDFTSDIDPTETTLTSPDDGHCQLERATGKLGR